MEIDMKAVYVMCDGASRKIGVSKSPSQRRSQLQNSGERNVTIIQEFWMKDDTMAARVEIMSHALAGVPSMGKEWFDISAEDACSAVMRSVEILSAQLMTQAPRRSTSEAQKRALEKQKLKQIAAGIKAVTVRLNLPTRIAIARGARLAWQTRSQFLEEAIEKEYFRLNPNGEIR